MREASLSDLAEAWRGYSELRGIPKPRITHAFLDEMAKKFPDEVKS